MERAVRIRVRIRVRVRARVAYFHTHASRQGCQAHGLVRVARDHALCPYMVI